MSRAVLLERVARSGRTTAEVGRTTYEQWRDDRCIRLGAGLAYYGVFALVPLLTLATALAGLLFSAATIREVVVSPVERVLGEEFRDVAIVLTDHITANGTLAQVGALGLGALVIASSLVFVAFQDALNVIWAVPYRHGLRQTLRQRLLAFGISFVTGSLLLVSLAAQGLVGLVTQWLDVEEGLLLVVTTTASSAVPLAVATAALTVLFVYLPPAAVDRRAAVVAALLTTVLMTVGVALVGLYLRRFGMASASGAASAALVVLVLVYVECQIVLVGAELTKVLTSRRTAGGGLGPSNDEQGP